MLARLRRVPAPAFINVPKRALATSIPRFTAQNPTVISHEDVPFAIGTCLVGESGRTYRIQEILSKSHPLGYLVCVYKARTDDGVDFILKNVAPRNLVPEYQKWCRGKFGYHNGLHKLVASSPFVRTPVDSIPEHYTFAYPLMRGTVLPLPVEPLSDETRKTIIKSALTGLADLHEKSIYHTDMKPTNILIDYDDLPGGDIAVRGVKISDLDSADIIPERHVSYTANRTGNQFWRSPEAWARIGQTTAADVYSFAVVAVWIMNQKMLFWVGDEDRHPKDGTDGDDEAWWTILGRHISYFAGQEDFYKFLDLVGEKNAYHGRLLQIMADIDRPDAETWILPFSTWPSISPKYSPEFGDLITKMTSFNPKKRITAREALEHPFFRGARTVPEEEGKDNPKSEA